MSPKRPHARRPAAALLFLLAACPRSQPAPPRPPPEPTPVTATAKASPPPNTGTLACEDPATAFTRYAWLPVEVRALVSVHLQDGRLPASIGTLKNYAQGPFIHDASWTNFPAELPALRALLTAAELSPSEAIYFIAGDDLGVWAVPGSCEPGDFARLAAALNLEVRQVAGSPSITIATGSTSSDYALVHRPSGGPLWITRADHLDPLLTWLGHSAGTWACCGQTFGDVPDATLRLFLLPDPSTFRQYSVTGTSLTMSGHTSCFIMPISSPK